MALYDGSHPAEYPRLLFELLVSYIFTGMIIIAISAARATIKLVPRIVWPGTGTGLLSLTRRDYSYFSKGVRVFHGPSRSVFLYCVQFVELVFTKCDNFCFLVFLCAVGKSCGVKTFLSPFHLQLCSSSLLLSSW